MPSSYLTKTNFKAAYDCFTKLHYRKLAYPIRIYQELIFLQGLTEEFKSNRKQLLLQYCELDTAAMVMIWAHWTGYVGAQEARRV